MNKENDIFDRPSKVQNMNFYLKMSRILPAGMIQKLFRLPEDPGRQKPAVPPFVAVNAGRKHLLLIFQTKALSGRDLRRQFISNREKFLKRPVLRKAEDRRQHAMPSSA